MQRTVFLNRSLGVSVLLSLAIATAHAATATTTTAPVATPAAPTSTAPTAPAMPKILSPVLIYRMADNCLTEAKIDIGDDKLTEANDLLQRGLMLIGIGYKTSDEDDGSQAQLDSADEDAKSGDLLAAATARESVLASRLTQYKTKYNLR